MIVVTGGIASGKRSYIRSLGYLDSEMAQGLQDPGAVLLDAQELARGGADDMARLADELAERFDVVACTEVGAGVLPLSADDRAWRERAGTLQRELAQRADMVVRMVCGIPTVLKGEDGPLGVEVVIMRHGSTPANERHEYAGSTDVPLSTLGEEQAVRAGVACGVERVYVSPLSRARRTAELCFPQAGQVVLDGLREMDFGAFEGRRAADMEDDGDYRAWVDGMCEGRCPGGEKRSELEARVAAAVHRMVRDALGRGDARAIAVGHGGTLMAAMDALAAEDPGYFSWQVGNCEGYRADAVIHKGRLRLVNWKRFSSLGFLEPADPSACEDRADASACEEGASFFSNRKCAYFPCHEGVAPDEFNCLLCYCPLYTLGPKCGGRFTYTPEGRKDCSACTLPHERDRGVSLVRQRYGQLADLAAQ